MVCLGVSFADFHRVEIVLARLHYVPLLVVDQPDVVVALRDLGPVKVESLGVISLRDNFHESVERKLDFFVELQVEQAVVEVSLDVVRINRNRHLVQAVQVHEKSLRKCFLVRSCGKLYAVCGGGDCIDVARLELENPLVNVLGFRKVTILEEQSVGLVEEISHFLGCFRRQSNLVSICGYDVVCHLWCLGYSLNFYLC